MASAQSSQIGNARSSLRQEVAERIKSYILDNRLRPGDPLPSEPVLCAALGASRSSVREAVKTLAALDIVEVRHGHGTYVGRLSLSALVEGLTFRGLLSPEDDFAVLAELVEVRELFERGMVDRIIPALDATRLDELDGLVTEMDLRLTAGQDIVDADRRFHSLLVAPLVNELVRQLSSACWDVYAIVAPHLKVVTAQDERDTVGAHRAMVAAVRAADHGAFVAAVRGHYAPVRRRIAEAQEKARGRELADIAAARG